MAYARLFVGAESLVPLRRDERKATVGEPAEADLPRQPEQRRRFAVHVVQLNPVVPASRGGRDEFVEPEFFQVGHTGILVGLAGGGLVEHPAVDTAADGLVGHLHPEGDHVDPLAGRVEQGDGVAVVVHGKPGVQPRRLVVVIQPDGQVTVRLDHNAGRDIELAWLGRVVAQAPVL